MGIVGTVDTPLQQNEQAACPPYVFLPREPGALVPGLTVPCCRTTNHSWKFTRKALCTSGDRTGIRFFFLSMRFGMEWRYGLAGAQELNRIRMSRPRLAALAISWNVHGSENVGPLLANNLAYLPPPRGSLASCFL